jgi:hypothetical protein
MSDRDIELDKLLKPLANMKANPKQIARWQAAARPASRDWKRQFMQVAAAVAIGFILGGWFFKNHQEEQSVTDNFDPTATIEMLYSKSE